MNWKLTNKKQIILVIEIKLMSFAKYKISFFNKNHSTPEESLTNILKDTHDKFDENCQTFNNLRHT